MSEHSFDQPRYTLPTTYLTVTWALLALLALLLALGAPTWWGVAASAATGALQGALLAIAQEQRQRQVKE